MPCRLEHQFNGCHRLEMRDNDIAQGRRTRNEGQGMKGRGGGVPIGDMERGRGMEI